jgi:hypothetical protein
MKTPGFNGTVDLAGLSRPQLIDIYLAAGGKAYNCGLGLTLE